MKAALSHLKLSTSPPHRYKGPYSLSCGLHNQVYMYVYVSIITAVPPCPPSTATYLSSLEVTKSNYIRNSCTCLILVTATRVPPAMAT